MLKHQTTSPFMIQISFCRDYQRSRSASQSRYYIKKL